MLHTPRCVRPQKNIQPVAEEEEEEECNDRRRTRAATWQKLRGTLFLEDILLLFENAVYYYVT